MKIVVVGASGNVGTAVLRALRKAGDVDEVVGLARRIPPRPPPAPYDTAIWRAVDVGDLDGTRAITTLASAMAGADAIIHLAWAIQPNHDRERLRRTNVLGTARMLEAARLAGVENVVVASSVGAYSPDAGAGLRDEAWPTRGVETCEYSVDKAAVERLLDEHERDYPQVTITRLRPALIFQRDAGSQIVRYFVGHALPPRVWRGGAPVLPWPSGIKLQAVHADDVASAYLAAVRLRPGGAFNIAAVDVLGASEVARLLSGGRVVEVPPALARAAISAGWNARIVPTSPGWIDMARAAPLMSTARAKSELGWSPARSAYDTVAEVMLGMADGAGTASPPLRPRSRTALKHVVLRRRRGEVKVPPHRLFG